MRRAILAFTMFGTITTAMLAQESDLAERNGQNAVEVLRGFYAGDTDVIMERVDEVYIQHSVAEDGRDALIEVVNTGQEEGWLSAEIAESFKPRRVIADEEFAAVHYLDEGEDKVYIDIFRFNENGKIGEHWDISQANSEPNGSGRDMLDGPAPVETSLEEEEANKAVVMRVYDEYFEQGDANMLSEVVHDLYIQHNPNGRDGLDFFSGFVERVGGPFENTVHTIFAEGDMVVIHAEYPGWNSGSIDIFRLKDQKIVEHWDVFNEIPEELPHENGYF